MESFLDSQSKYGVGGWVWVCVCIHIYMCFLVDDNLLKSPYE